MYNFLNDLCESKLIPSKTSLKKWDVTKLSELAYLYILGLRFLIHESSNRQWAIDYCKKTGNQQDFSKWMNAGNDLYIMLYSLSADEDDNIEGDLPHDIKISPAILTHWLRNPTNKEDTHKIFMRLDSMFRINNSSMKNLRRIVMNIEDSDDREKKNTLDKIIRLIHTRAPTNNEISEHLEKMFDEDLKESSSVGATSSSSIAVAVGGLGAGFNPKEKWRSIYGESKPIVIKR